MVDKSVKAELIRLRNKVNGVESKYNGLEADIQVLKKAFAKSLAHLNGVLNRMVFLKTRLKEISVENKLDGDTIDELLANIEEINTIVPGKQYIKYTENERGFIVDFEIVDDILPDQEIPEDLGAGFWKKDEHGDFYEDQEEKERLWGELNE